MRSHFLRILYFLFLLSPSYTMAQEQFMFKRLETKNGLLHSQVNDIYKDSNGFMWFATAGGLNRYDGYEFKAFRFEERNPYSLPDNYVDQIQEDVNGDLWVHTGVGYAVYNTRKGIFICDITSILKGFGINGVPSYTYIDKAKDYWFYVDSVGAFQYQPSTQKLVSIPWTGPEALTKGAVTCIRESEEGMLFVFNTGLIECVDRLLGKVVRRDNYIPLQMLPPSEKYAVFVDSNEDYWVYSKGNSGLWLYRNKLSKWEHVTNNPGSTYQLSSNVIQAIAEDRNKRIWLATDHGGIDIIDNQTGTVTNLQHSIFDERSLSHNSINSVYNDDVNIVWVGTYKRGVSYYSESLFKFEVDYLPYFKLNKDFESDVTYVESDARENLWVGTNGNGLIRMNRTTGERKLYEHIPGVASSLPANVVVSLCAARDGKLWIGTYLGGMCSFDGTQFTCYKHDPGNPNSLASNDVWSIVDDTDGCLWIGTLGGGLQRFNPLTREFTTYKGWDVLSSDYISSLCLGKDNILYIGTAVGVTLYHKDKKTFEKLEGNRAGTQKFSNSNVNQVLLDSRGLLWVATRDGLSAYNQKNDSIVTIHKTGGLADDFVCAIAEDNNQNLWVTTSNGVSNIIVSINPHNGSYDFTCHNYDELDGLQGREFNIRSIDKTDKGEIVMGGTNGFNVLNPGHIKYNETPPHVLFTSLQLFNREVKIDSLYNGNKILGAPLSLTKAIELRHKQDVFSISFSGMNYVLPEKSMYAYMLEGFNDDWLYVNGYNHKVTYTSLAPGTYTLKVKAANSDGYWNEQATSLTIIVHPPFWRTDLAYALYFVFLSSFLILGQHFLMLREHQNFRIKQKEIEAQRKHEMDDMKLRFFTNISHELRTPLSLVISPIEGLIKAIDNKEQKEKLVLMRRNAMRLMNMLNQLLDFRKNDVKGHRLNLFTGDAIACLRVTCQSFIELSEKKNIRLTFSSTIESLVMNFDEDKLSKVMMNLLSNAFKFTPDGGSVNVGVSLIPADEEVPLLLEVSVADTGIGVKDEDKERVFERFYQATSNAGSNTSGSGIGLHLAKDFVELHYGTIYVRDNTEKGSVFVFTIPVEQTQETDECIEQGEESTMLYQPEEIISEGHEIDHHESSNAPLILIIDDSDDFRYFMRDSLKGKFNIREAVNGQQAWDMIPELQPDMIISDVMMPEMSGTELCRKVKTDVRTSHIPLILLTARTAEEQKLEGLELGADDYITKPFNLEILSLRIQKLLELRHRKQEQFRKQIDPVPSEITITSLDEKLIERAIKYVEDNIARSELSVEEMSRELGMSRVHLYKKLMAITGKSPVEFIRIIRLKRAAQLLKKSQMNVSEIAFEVGFNNPRYFSRYFKEQFGVLPSEYKARG